MTSSVTNCPLAEVLNSCPTSGTRCATFKRHERHVICISCCK
jgi:hypothetical protein